MDVIKTNSMALIKSKLAYYLITCFVIISGSVFGYDKPIRLVAAPALENNPPSTFINTNASQTVQLSAPGATSYDKEIIGTVKLIVKTNAPQYVSPYDAEVNLLITAYDVNGNIISNATNVLKANHQPFTNSSYKDQDYAIFNNQALKVYKIVTKITQIKVNNVVVNVLPDNLLIESTIDYLRYNQFSWNLIPGAPVINPIDQDGDANPDVLEITWNPINGAYNYEFEYTSVNDYDLSGIANPKASNLINFDFKNNSTRIVTFANTYTVPLIFDRGYFLCRVRGTGKDISGVNPGLLPYNGNWSYNSNTGTVNNFVTATPSLFGWVYVASHFENYKNWQYNATFAEEGKHKDVINYADGSLRSRQTVTKIYSDNTTIVGENVYDYTGRSAVNIIPNPLPKITLQNNVPGSASFLYKNNFNISDNTNQKFSKADFDLDDNGNPCLPSTSGLSISSGSSKYYSTNNPDKDDYQAYVPDAQKFPFTQVEYTPDNTGRIKKQSGVGVNHKLGSGHETKYFYGSPEQIEIDRLFGSEVGDASHYQKNMVIDANGQVSITYMDMEGKTIATSLAGSSPTNMVNMPKQPPTAVNLKADMFNKDALGVSENNLVNTAADAITFNKSILVSDNNTPNVFSYSMSIGTFSDNCLANNVCFNCVYDFEMKIVDDCGSVKYSTVNNGKKMIGRFNVVGNDTIFTTTCYGPVPYSYTEIANSPSLNLQAGVYYVSKTLKINTDARDFYLKKYLSAPTNTCVFDLNHFQQIELAKIDTTDCFVSCASCFKSLGTKDDYVSLGKGTEEEWEAKYEECRTLCGYPKTTCEINLGMLLADVSPNGQYGEYQTPGDPLSVFNPGNLLPKNIATIPAPSPVIPNPTQLNVINNVNNGPVTAKPPYDPTAAYWKKPRYYKTNSTQYLDKKGKRYKVILTKIPNGPNPGNYSYAVDNLALVFTTPTVGVYYTWPENLTNLDDFITVWQPSFAKSLVTYHPEYCYYQDCIDRFGKKLQGDSISSNDYDSKLLFTTTFSAAVAKGLIVPVNNNVANGYMLSFGHDPANNSGYFAPALLPNATPLIQKYNTYNVVNATPLSLHKFVSYSLKCGTQYGNNQLQNVNCTTFGAPIVGTQAQITAMQNNEWNSLKAIYYGEKQKMLYEYSNAKRLQAGSSCAYYNACIGNPNFDGYSSPMVKFNIAPGNQLNQNSPYFIAQQPCNQSIKDLYASKEKRFGNFGDEETPDENEIAYQVYLQTGKCPNALDLQNLMHALAQNSKLHAPSEALQNYPQMTINFYNYINNASPPPTPYTAYLWEASILGGNVLNMNIKKAINNTVVKFIQLNPPVGGIIWANVKGVSQFMHTGVAGPNQTFSCTVQVLIGANLVYKSVTGLTNIKLDGCMFKDICKPNDLAKQLQTVMSALKASNNFQSLSPVTLGAPGGNTFYGPYLQKTQQLIGQNINTPNFKWQYVANSTFSYDLFDNSTPTCKLRVNLLTLNNNPITLLNLSTIVSFKKIRSDYQNFFTMEARDYNNALVGIVKGEVFKICGGQPIPISMGTCDKPDPASCQTQFHKNRKDLELLLKDILESQKYLPVANANVSNVVTNVNLTNNLIGNYQPLAANLPTTKYVVASNFHRIVSGQLINNNTTLNNDSVTFTLKSPCLVPTPTVDPNPNPNPNQNQNFNLFAIPQQTVPPVNPPCAESIYCKVWLKTNNKTQPGSVSLPYLSKVKKLVGYGPIVNNNYTDFYLLVEYTYNNIVFGDTIFGGSCFELQNCNPCKEDLNACCGGTVAPAKQQDFPPLQLDSLAVVGGVAQINQSLATYSVYSARIAALNSSNGWTPLDTSYIQPQSFAELNVSGYQYFMTHFNNFIDHYDSTLDNRMLLKDVSLFASDQGFVLSPMQAYNRYLNATNDYNAKALVLNSNTLAPIADTSFYFGGYVDSSYVYVNYLLSMPQPSITTLSAPAFFASRAGLPNPPDPACAALYNSYVTAYLQFINNPNNITNCGVRWLDDVPMYPYSLFMSYGYCCAPNYIAFNNYINSFYSNNPCPQALTPLEACNGVMPPSIDECTPWYSNYNAIIAQYNASPWAINNNIYLNANLFAGISSFYQQGYCKCVLSYMNYLNQYLFAQPNDILPPPVSIKNWQGCGPGDASTCDETYNNYISATNTFLSWLNLNPMPGLLQLPVTYDITEFTNNGLCYCAPGYISFLNGIVSGAITDINYINQNFSIQAFCNQKSIACPTPNSLDTIVSLPVPPSQNPCVKYKKDLAMANAQNAYQQYLADLTTKFITAYNKYCLGATESLIRDYSSKEFHYTLYYYDQAGNLIRTIPPEGLDAAHYTSITSYLSPKAIQAKNDRTYKTKTLFTKHTMPTTYQYNSLNQLVKQKMPDHDALNYIKYKFNYGLDTAMTIVTSQFPDKNKGYAGGNETYTDQFIGSFTRGKLFESTDGSLSWKPLGNIAGTDINKIQFLTAGGIDYGFAVGSDGAFLFSVDAGVNWDYYPIHDFTNGNSTLNDVYFYQKNNNTLEGYAVGDNGVVVRLRFNGNANIISYNVIQLTNAPFTNNDNITDVTADNNNQPNFYITVLDKTLGTSKIYSSNGNGNSGNWVDITATRLPNLNKVRQLKLTSNLYAAGSDGNLLKSSDNGNTWVMKETNTALNFLDVYFATANAGVAVLQDASGIGSLYKTIDGGNNWVLFESGTVAKNYNSLSPYENPGSTTIDKLTANANNGIVKRVTINYTTPATILVGAVTTSISTANQINDVCVVPYDVVNNTNYKQMAIATGNNGELQYCLDYTQNNPVWLPIITGLGNLKKTVINVQNLNINPKFDGVILTDAGLIYSFKCPDITVQAPLFNIAPLVQGGNGNTNSYTDLVFDRNGQNPYGYAYFTGKNNNTQLQQFAHMPLVNVGNIGNTSPVVHAFLPTTQQQANSLLVNAGLGTMLAVGTNADITKGSNFGIPNNTPATLNMSVNSTSVSPLQINDIQLDPVGQKIAVVGNDGYYADRPISGSSPFQIKNSTTASDITSMKYAGQFFGALYYASSKQGEILTLIAPVTLTMAAPAQTLTTASLNDIAIKVTGNNVDAYLAGDNGTAFYRTNASITQVASPTSENFNTAAFYPSNSNAVIAGNLTTAYDVSGINTIANKNWFTNQITKLHFTDPGNGYVVGIKGLIRHTNDGGFTWRTVKPPYLNPNNNNPIDLYAVYTTTVDKAVIAGSNNYISNVTNLTVAALPIIGGVGSPNQTWYDFDLTDANNGFVVGSNTNNNTAKAAALSLNNNSVVTSPLPQTIPSVNSGEGLKAVYAFKDNHAGKFIAVGESRTLKVYNGIGYANINYSNQNINTVFSNATDVIYDLDFSDNSNGYIVGARNRFASVDLNLGTNPVAVGLIQQVTNLPTLGSTGAQITNNSEIRTVSLIDDVSGFLGGYVATNNNYLGKYGWKFTHEKGQTSTLFWYDKLGRIVLSQNTKQINKPQKAYSYTSYDALGRITEVGEKAENANPVNQFDKIFGTYVGIYYNTNAIDDAKLAAWINDNTGSRIEVTHTYYDDPYFTPANCPLPNTFAQDNLRKRIASVTYEDVWDNNPCTYNHASHYTYDIHGNVKTLLQDNKALATPNNNPLAAFRFTRIDYDYDLISGKVNQVSYQAGQPDAFYHRYEYDDDNRITEVKTSRNGNVWETDAKYFYYKHDELARVEFGNDKVQGVDYAHTLQGWIKGVNSNKLRSGNDIGKDGDGSIAQNNTNKNKLFAQDAFGYTIGYFDGDYNAIDNTLWASANRFESVTAGSTLESNSFNLYNGNISHMATSIVQPLNLTGPLANNYLLNPLPAASAYKYDQVGRIREANHYENFNTATNTWANTANPIANQYKNTFVYDDNGNIMQQTKYDGAGNLMDNLDYLYNTSGIVGGKLKQNRLYSLKENAPISANPNDIETPGFNFNIAEATINTANNYSYDELGNLTKDGYEDITSIIWTDYGKIKSITRTPNSIKKNLRFDYDAQGHRVAKHVYSSNNVFESSTYYVRDVAGNVIAIYDNRAVCVANCQTQNPVYGLSYKLIERNLYGSSRLGADEHAVELIGGNYNPSFYERIVGSKQFEMSNHLDNVNTIVSDRKIPITINNINIDHFIPFIVMATDYNAFGDVKDQRQFNLSSSRVGFNSKENDNEVKGVGNQQDYGSRIYDSRLGRFLSVDPIGKNFAFYSTYQFAGNKPTVAIDIDGLEDVYVITTKGKRTISLKFNRTDINAIAAGGHAARRIHYDKSKESVGQFQGPNKKNEKLVFEKLLADKEDFIKNDLVPNNLKVNAVTTGYGPIKPVAVPEPAPPVTTPPPTLDIKFENKSDKFSDPAEASKQIKPLVDYLKNNPKATVDLIGNAQAASGGGATGNGADVLSSKTLLNGKEATTADLMKARAKSVESELIKNGIPASRINSMVGSVGADESSKNVGVNIKK